MGYKIYYQDLTFTDPDGDTYHIDWEVVSTNATFQLDPRDGPVSNTIEEQKQGAIVDATWFGEADGYTVTVRGTLKDKAGNFSEPIEYTLVCD